MNFKKWVKSIQTAGYNGARTVYNKAYGIYKSLGFVIQKMVVQGSGYRISANSFRP